MLSLRRIYTRCCEADKMSEVKMLELFAVRIPRKKLVEKNSSLLKQFSKEELIKLCHSRIPKMRHIEGFIDSNLITPLPIWSPVSKKFRRSAKDSFSVWGIEAQLPKYLPLALQPYVFIKCRGKGKRKVCFIQLKPEAYKK